MRLLKSCGNRLRLSQLCNVLSSNLNTNITLIPNNFSTCLLFECTRDHIIHISLRNSLFLNHLLFDFLDNVFTNFLSLIEFFDLILLQIEIDGLFDLFDRSNDLLLLSFSCKGLSLFFIFHESLDPLGLPPFLLLLRRFFFSYLKDALHCFIFCFLRCLLLLRFSLHRDLKGRSWRVNLLNSHLDQIRLTFIFWSSAPALHFLNKFKL